MSYIISFIFGCVIGLIAIPSLKGLVFGQVKVPKGRGLAYKTVPGYEDKEILVGFKARFFSGIFLILILSVGGLFWYGLADIKVNFQDIYFYIKIMAIAGGSYVGVKLTK